MAKRHEIDMCGGNLFKNIILFTIPLDLSGMLQLAFNMADIVVVGRFAGKESLAAVGSTTSLINLIINLFLGMSSGTTIVVSRYFGAKNYEGVSKAVHTAVALSIFGGIALGIFGFTFSKTFLHLMDSPADVIDKAALYMKIYFIGLPATLLYNYESAILRAVGNTKKPLFFLSISGVVNVALNLVFVIIFRLDVAGVAIATAISQVVSAILCTTYLVRSDGAAYQLFIKEVRFWKEQLIEIMKLGIPAGIQGSMFSLSNVLIQSSVNSLGSIVIAGNSAASNIEGFAYTAMNAVHQATITSVSQNYGAKNEKRIKKAFLVCLGLVIVIGIFVGGGIWLFRKFFIGIYSSDPEVIYFGGIKLTLVCLPYFLCGIMEVCVGLIRGLSYSIMPVIVTLIGTCVLRIAWIYTVFATIGTFESIMISYPISWSITAFAHFISYLCVKKKAFKKMYEQE